MTEMTRKDHVEWCKKRALEYVEIGELANAVASMGTDMGKHSETRAVGDTPLMWIGMQAAVSGDADAVRHWIEGFA